MRLCKGEDGGCTRTVEADDFCDVHHPSVPDPSAEQFARWLRLEDKQKRLPTCQVPKEMYLEEAHAYLTLDRNYWPLFVLRKMLGHAVEVL